VILLPLLLCFLLPAPAHAQGGAKPPSLQHVERLYAEGRDQELVDLVPASPEISADFDLYRGLALARLGRLEEAKAALAEGHAKAPRRERFLVEMAGVDFKRNDFGTAKNELQEALQLAPGDEYARNFLATLFFLEDNLDAALENWNKLGQPNITALKLDPEPRLRPELLQRAIRIPPVGTLRLGDLRTSRALLDNLDIFPLYRFDLLPSTAGAYAVGFRSIERNGWGASTMGALLSIFRGFPTSIYPEYYNLHGEAINLLSQFRWDENKRRVFASVSMPLDDNPRWRFSFQVDARNENWNLSDTFHGGTVPVSDLNMETIEAGPQLRSVESDRWAWQVGMVYAYRRFRNLANVPAGADEFFTGGGSLEYRSLVQYRLLDSAAHRLTINTTASASFGKNFARGLGGFGTTVGGLEVHWFPRTGGEDYETTAQFRVGRAWGAETLDQLFQLGIERDNNLWLRGIAGTSHGRKGNAPLGREYALWNLETDKIIFDHSLLTVKLGPFLDIGRSADSTGYFGSSGWLWDPGGILKLRVYNSITVIVSYGQNLPSGPHAFYVTASR
jgi:tetratricopeptide (TPR) repeat protein